MLHTLVKKHSEQAVRFFIVSVTGLVIDIGTAWALIALAGTPDLAAAVAGFTVATISNYFGHQFWTFHETGPRQVSLRRFMGFAGVVVLTLAVRLSILDWLGPMLPGSGLLAPIRLGLAAVASFFVSFLLSKFFVFGRRGESSAR